MVCAALIAEQRAVRRRWQPHMACRCGSRLKVPRTQSQQRCALASAFVAAGLLATLLLLQLPSDGRSAARRRSRYADRCSAAELFHSEVYSLTGAEWWLTSVANVLLEKLRSLPAGQYRAPKPSGASNSIERLSRLSFVVPWQDVNISIPPVYLNMTVGEYIDRADSSWLLVHVLAALVVGIGGWLLACGPHTVAWRRCPRLQPKARPHSEVQRSIPKFALRILFVCSTALALVIMWANGALSAILLELPAKYETAMTALHSASEVAREAALRLQLELDWAARTNYGMGSNSTSTVINQSLSARYGGGSCELSVMVVSLQCYATHLDVMAAGLNATWPVLQQSDLAGVGTRNNSATSGAGVDADSTSYDQVQERDISSSPSKTDANEIGRVRSSSTHAAVGDGSFLQVLAMGNSLREKTTTAAAALLLFLSWLAVLASTYERPGLLSLCSLLSACSAAGLILSGIAVLLCAMLLADLCAVADLGRTGYGGSGREPARNAYERQALQLASAHLESDAACQALLAGQDRVGTAVIDELLPVTLLHPSEAGAHGRQEDQTENERRRCGDWLQGHRNQYYDSGDSGDSASVAVSSQERYPHANMGLTVANVSGHWPTAHHYITYCTHNRSKPDEFRSAHDEYLNEELRLPSSQRTWLHDWLLMPMNSGIGTFSKQNESRMTVTPAEGSCGAVGVPYVEAISPLPCRDALPVLATMWFGAISGALILCCTSCVAATSAHSFNADQLWESAVAEEVAKLMRQYDSPTAQAQASLVGGQQPLQLQADSGSEQAIQSSTPDFSFYTPPGRKLSSSAGNATGGNGSGHNRLRSSGVPEARNGDGTSAASRP